MIDREKIALDIVNEINKLRLKTKDINGNPGWYFYINEKYSVKVKGYKTWIQIIEINTDSDCYIKDESPMDLNVKEFKDYLWRMLFVYLELNQEV